MPGSRYLHERDDHAADQPHPAMAIRTLLGDERHDVVERGRRDEDADRRQDDQQRLDDQPTDLPPPIVDDVELRLERGRRRTRRSGSGASGARMSVTGRDICLTVLPPLLAARKISGSPRNQR
jgi:hypothetical protein